MSKFSSDDIVFNIKKDTEYWSAPLRALLLLLLDNDLPDLPPQERMDLLKLLVRHRLLTRYARYLIEKYPNSKIAQLVARSKKSFTKSQLLLSGHILKLGKAMDQAGLDYIALKGPVLSQMLYNEVSMRQSSDIDLWVAPKNVVPCIHLLEGLGYAWQDRVDFEHPTFHSTYLKINEEASFVMRGDADLPIKVDLHWEISSPPSLFPSFGTYLKSGLDSFEFHGLKVNVLSPEVNFVYLCLHGAKHKWFRLQWLADIVMYIDKEINWSKVIEITREDKLERPIVQALLLAKAIFSVEIPERLHDLVESTPKAYALAANALVAIAKDESFMRSSIRSNLFHLTLNLMSLKPGAGYKLSCLKRLLLSPKDWELVKLPSSLILLYIALRPLLFFIRIFRAS